MVSDRTIPDIEIDGLRYRSSTLTTTHALDPMSVEDRCETLDELLRECHIKHATEDLCFWSDELLIRIMTRNRVMDELQLCEKISRKEIEGYANQIVIETTSNSNVVSNPKGKKYLKIFAVLVLMDRVSDIAAFIEDGIGDSSLPLVRCTSQGRRGFALRESPKKPLEPFRGWKGGSLDSWDLYQWRLIVPFFEMGPGNIVIHSIFDSKVILPWCWTKPVESHGGYATVTQVRMDRSCHGFHGVLDSISMNGLFALKALDKDDENEFKKEVDMLKRFSGIVDDHLVTLLTTFRWKNQYHLLFPWADYDMDEYMDREPGPIVHDAEAMRWLSGQILGITKAIGVIHEPAHLHGDPRFGRHGDLKPENVLWFNSDKGAFKKGGIFVISDFGLGAFHRDTSRSNIPNRAIPHTPGYRPPECDIKGGKISRAYDIWTLGCLFLELVTWCLGGSAMRKTFGNTRMAPYITGSNSDIFFNIKPKEKGPGYVVSVKDQVTEWFQTLHIEPACTQFIHDLLNVIQEHMITVISAERPNRIRSLELIRKINRIHENALDGNRPGYITTPCPNPQDFRPDDPVDATLNEEAERLIGLHHPRLPTHRGLSQQELSTERMSALALTG